MHLGRIRMSFFFVCVCTCDANEFHRPKIKSNVEETKNSTTKKIDQKWAVFGSSLPKLRSLLSSCFAKTFCHICKFFILTTVDDAKNREKMQEKAHHTHSERWIEKSFSVLPLYSSSFIHHRLLALSKYNFIFILLNKVFGLCYSA